MRENRRTRNEKDSFLTYDNKYTLMYIEYILILKTFNILLCQDMMSEGTVYKLPARAGRIGVFKRKTFGRGSFDYNYFKQTGEKVWRRNFHSGTFSASYQWLMKGPWTDLPYALRRLFVFRPSRDNKRSLAKYIKISNTINKYYDLE